MIVIRLRDRLGYPNPGMIGADPINSFFRTDQVLYDFCRSIILRRGVNGGWLD